MGMTLRNASGLAGRPRVRASGAGASGDARIFCTSVRARKKGLYHVLEQLVELRSCGMLHEGVVEAVHVVDNRMILRFGCVQNLEQQVRCRLRAIWQQQDPSGAPRIRERESAQQDVKRRRLNTERRLKRLRE
jgi:hypothetical protein